MWLIIDRIIEKVLRYYHKRVFLARIKCKSNDVRVFGKVHILATNVKIGENVTIYPGVTFWGDGEILIGDNVDLGFGTIIFSSKFGGISIGNDVAIAAHCYIIDSDHGMNMSDLIRNQKLVSDKIYIGNDVWIAENWPIPDLSDTQ